MARAKPRAPWLHTIWILIHIPSQLVKKTAGCIFQVSWKFAVIVYCLPFCRPFSAFCSICVLWLMLCAVCSHVSTTYIVNECRAFGKARHRSAVSPRWKAILATKEMSYWWGQYLLVSIFMRSLLHCKVSGLNRWTLHSWTTTEELKAASGVLVDGVSLTYLCSFNVFRSSNNFLRYLNTSWTLLQQYTNPYIIETC